MDKLYRKLNKLDCKLDELDKLRISSMSALSWTISWIS